MKPVDIKYLGVPNVCFSLTDKEDKRDKGFAEQRIKRGFDDSETWSLRDTISNFIIPRLERYQEIAPEMIQREPELVDNINKLLEAFKLISRDDGALILTKEEEKKMVDGLNQFSKVFMSLWW